LMVKISITRSSPTAPSSTRRRRQYTEGGCGPTG
jgi:hypothetical protein